MRHIFVIAFLTVSLAAWTTPRALGWNKAGHMVTGAIAYEVLKKDNEKTIPKVIALLKQHPQFASWEKQADKLKLEGDDRDLYYFTKAARWADDARGDPKYYPPDLENDKMHYINYPFKPEGQPESVKTAPPADINIIVGYAKKLEIVAGKASDAERAIALCWIFHLVGDVHQPLHTSTLFTTTFPNGDRGGTRFYIRVTDKNRPINLHKFWDDLLIGSENFQSVRNKATELHARKEFAKDKLTELTAATEFQQWAAKESLALAKQYGYQNGKLEGAAVENMAPVLPADYAMTVQPIAERRGVLAGYRLAAVLRKHFD